MPKHPFRVPNEHVVDVNSVLNFCYGGSPMEDATPDFGTPEEKGRTFWRNVQYSSLSQIALVLKTPHGEVPVSLSQVSADNRECLLQRRVGEHSRSIRLTLEKFCADNHIDVLCIQDIAYHRVKELRCYEAPRTTADEMRYLIFLCLTLVIPAKYLSPKQREKIPLQDGVSDTSSSTLTVPPAHANTLAVSSEWERVTA